MNKKSDKLLAEFIEYESKLLRHARFDYLRRIRLRGKFEILKEPLITQDEDSEPSVDDMQMIDEELQMKWVLAGLDFNEQQIIRLCVIEDRSALEVAAAIGRSERWIHIQKKRALVKLKNSMVEGEQGDSRR